MNKSQNTESKNHSTLLLSGGEVLTHQNSKWSCLEKDVLIENDRIVSVHNRNNKKEKADKVIDCSGMVIVPGLHNCHSHLLEFWQRSLHEKFTLETFVPYKSSLDVAVDLQPHEIESIVRLACLELLKNGVTSVVDHMFQRPMLSSDSIDAALNALSTSGIRGWLSPAMVDLSTAEMHALNYDEIPIELREELRSKPTLPKSEQIELTKYAIKKTNEFDNNRTNIVVGPGAPTFCSPELFEEAVELSLENNLLLHTHLLESRGQRIVSNKHFGKGSISYLNDIGALNSNFFAAHTIWIDKNEIQLLADKGSSVVHNPCSNLRGGSGVSPVLNLRDAGVNIAFGTDGGDTSDSYSIIDQARVASLLHRAYETNIDKWITGEEAFTMAAMGGANILNRGESGNVIEGNLADIAIMERDFRFFPPGPLARQLVHVGGGDIKHVIVGGEIVIENKKPTLFEEAKDVEVLKNVINRGLSNYDKSIEAGDRLHPFLRSVYDKFLHEIGSFKPGD